MNGEYLDPLGEIKFEDHILGVGNEDVQHPMLYLSEVLKSALRIFTDVAEPGILALSREDRSLSLPEGWEMACKTGPRDNPWVNLVSFSHHKTGAAFTISVELQKEKSQSGWALFSDIHKREGEELQKIVDPEERERALMDNLINGTPETRAFEADPANYIGSDEARYVKKIRCFDSSLPEARILQIAGEDSWSSAQIFSVTPSTRYAGDADRKYEISTTVAISCPGRAIQILELLSAGIVSCGHEELVRDHLQSMQEARYLHYGNTYDKTLYSTSVGLISESGGLIDATAKDRLRQIFTELAQSAANIAQPRLAETVDMLKADGHVSKDLAFDHYGSSNSAYTIEASDRLSSLLLSTEHRVFEIALRMGDSDVRGVEIFEVADFSNGQVERASHLVSLEVDEAGRFKAQQYVPFETEVMRSIVGAFDAIHACFNCKKEDLDERLSSESIKPGGI